MHATVMQPELKRALRLITPAIAPRSTLPVLACVLARTETFKDSAPEDAEFAASDQHQLVLQATNLDASITMWLPCAHTITHEDGALAIPHKTFADIVNTLGTAPVDLETDERTESVKVTSAKTRCEVRGINADEFPTIPVFDPATSLCLSISARELRKAIDLVAFCAAPDDTRPVLAGVDFSLTGTKLTLSATDGFRLSTYTIDLAAPPSGRTDVLMGTFEFIMPARNCEMIGTIIDGEDSTVEMIVRIAAGSPANLMVRASNIEYGTRLIDGKFPDWHRIRPKDKFLSRIVVDRRELKRLISQVQIFAVSSSNIVTLTATRGEGEAPGKLKLNSVAAEVGHTDAEIDVSLTGEDALIKVNTRFLAEAVDSVPHDQIVLEFRSPAQPLLLFNPADESLLHILMPMTVR
jgi:DNA polymerase-3 subunit beta